MTLSTDCLHQPTVAFLREANRRKCAEAEVGFLRAVGDVGIITDNTVKAKELAERLTLVASRTKASLPKKSLPLEEPNGQ